MATEKRKNVITAIVLAMAVLISLAFILYSQVKANEAERNAMEALRQTELALHEKERADKLKEAAQRSAAEALAAKAEADRVMKLLEECRSR